MNLGRPQFGGEARSNFTDICRQLTEVRFASFLSGGFITAIVVNPPERKLAKRTSVSCGLVLLRFCGKKNYLKFF